MINNQPSEQPVKILQEKQIENEYYSYNSGPLPDGCQYCVRGEKLVLFVTGLCPRDCYFCPISDKKYGHDVIYANERSIPLHEQAAAEQDGTNQVITNKVIAHQVITNQVTANPVTTDQNTSDQVIEEARLMQARGAGITGGDPLMKLERTIYYIQQLKKTFGSSFHIHLYTSLNLATETALKQLYEAGLDEIRFHLDLDDTRFWNNLSLARTFPWKVGVEIPCIAAKIPEMKQVADYLCGKADFLNLNELERADNERSQLDSRGLKTIHQYSYAINGSMSAGWEIMNYVKEKNYAYPVHVCTAKLKENVQLGNRMKRESSLMKRKFDQVDPEGVLKRGALYLPELAPGFAYRQKLEQCSKLDYINQLKPLLNQIKKELILHDDDLALDQEKPRILLSEFHVRKNKRKIKQMGLLPAVVQEMPTADQLEVEVEFV